MNIIKHFKKCQSKKIRCFIIDNYSLEPKYYKEIICCSEDYIVVNEYDMYNRKIKTDTIWKYSPYWNHVKIYNRSKIRNRIF